jgi:DNA helicase-2/ATP-dependent DNA helicase PcrA
MEHSLILEGLNPSQVEAVTQPSKAVTRVIAGPGSGKTKVLTCRVVYLLDQDPRSRVLAVTFTKKAAEEMRNRVELLLIQQQQQHDTPSMTTHGSGDDEVVSEDLAPNVPKDLGRVTMGTFHSICAKILRFNGDLLESLPSVQDDMVGRIEGGAVNLDGNFAILDASDQLRILKECLDENEIDLKKSSVKPLQVMTAIGTIKEARAQGKDPFAEFNDNQRKKPIPKPLKYAKDVYGLYREKLLSNNALDFDDLIFMTREILMEYPVLRERLHQRWPHVLIDEFQDTSIIQMDLVKLLTSHSLFVVGDADQSIYSWRGAHAGSLSDFRTEFHDFAEAGVHTVFLKENYRYVLSWVSFVVLSSSLWLTNHVFLF